MEQGKEKKMRNPNLDSFQNNLNNLIQQQVDWWVLGESSPICVFLSHERFRVPGSIHSQRKKFSPDLYCGSSAKCPTNEVQGAHKFQW
jgi:hypothetical protein